MASSQSIPLNNGQQAIIQNDFKKVFLWNYRTLNGSLNNAAYVDLNLPEGTVIGRVSSSNLFKVFTSGASDGSQFPIGVVIDDTVVPFGTTKNITIGHDGDVNANALIFQGGDTLNTVVSGRTVRDHLKMYGVNVVDATELTKLDNQ